MWNERPKYADKFLPKRERKEQDKCQTKTKKIQERNMQSSSDDSLCGGGDASSYDSDASNSSVTSESENEV